MKYAGDQHLFCHLTLSVAASPRVPADASILCQLLWGPRREAFYPGTISKTRGGNISSGMAFHLPVLGGLDPLELALRHNTLGSERPVAYHIWSSVLQWFLLKSGFMGLKWIPPRRTFRFGSGCRETAAPLPGGGSFHGIEKSSH